MENSAREKFIQQLSDKEFEVMSFFWREDRPLTGGDVKAISEDDRSFHHTSARFIVNSLVRKGYIEEAGFIKTKGGQAAQAYQVKIRREDDHLTRFHVTVGDKQNKSEAALSVATAFLKHYCDVSEEKMGQILGLINEV